MALSRALRLRALAKRGRIVFHPYSFPTSPDASTMVRMKPNSVAICMPFSKILGRIRLSSVSVGSESTEEAMVSAT